ncbi:MAG: class I SAM-dependent methyltransferase [Candidatus Eremiobacteraeota bacterium]|nr:class I SAM-dependent methyltransferase [Candidatus Eremiobacteraeota bacterium]
MELVPASFSLAGATFVDIGSGMGRVVMLASHHPFRQVLGIEISPALHEIARENVRVYTDARQRCRDIRLVRADAAEVALPPGNLAIYLYNPFQGRILARLLERLHDDRREIVLLYHTAVEREVIERNPAFETIGDVEFGAAYRASFA